MSNISAKKQNRVLLITLITVLACAAVLIAVTGSANKSKKEATPAPDTRESETVEDKSYSKPGGKEAGALHDTESETQSVKEEIGKKAETSDTVVAEPEDAEVSAMEDEPLPSFSSPVSGVVIKDYSDSVPVYSCTMNDYRVHNGLDFAASVGTPVYSCADGIVSEVNDDPMMGVCVSISHSGGALSEYKGLSEESLSMLSVGDSVERGQVIGSAGDTALIESAEENHVHFELSVNGESQNPSEFFPVTRLSDLTED